MAKLAHEIKTRNAIKAHYQKNAVVSVYVEDRFREPMGLVKHEQQIAIVNDLLARIPQPIVLDLACGPARVSKDLVGVHKGYAIDASEGMLVQARALLNSKWIVTEKDAFALDFPSNFFDVIVSIRFFRHFDAMDRACLYENVRRVLKKDGYFVVDALNEKTTKWIRRLRPYKVYDEQYTLESLHAEIEKNGFRIVQCVPIVRRVFMQGMLSKITKNMGLASAGLQMVRALERGTGGNPWEWIAVCKKN